MTKRQLVLSHKAYSNENTYRNVGFITVTLAPYYGEYMGGRSGGLLAEKTRDMYGMYLRLSIYR